MTTLSVELVTVAPTPDKFTVITDSLSQTRATGWTRTQQADKLNLSIATIDRIIKRLKVKYDACQKISPLLPPRKFSAKETYMDTH